MAFYLEFAFAFVALEFELVAVLGTLQFKLKDADCWITIFRSTGFCCIGSKIFSDLASEEATRQALRLLMIVKFGISLCQVHLLILVPFPLLALLPRSCCCTHPFLGASYVCQTHKGKKYWSSCWLIPLGMMLLSSRITSFVHIKRLCIAMHPLKREPKTKQFTLSRRWWKDHPLSAT